MEKSEQNATPVTLRDMQKAPQTIMSNKSKLKYQTTEIISPEKPKENDNVVQLQPNLVKLLKSVPKGLKPEVLSMRTNMRSLTVGDESALDLQVYWDLVEQLEFSSRTGRYERVEK